MNSEEVGSGLLKEEDSIVSSCSSVTSKLFTAIDSDRADLLKRILSKPSELYAEALTAFIEGPNDFYGETLLHFAVGKGCLPIIRLLLEHGADVNARTVLDKKSPLHVACWFGNEAVARVLVTYNAEWNALMNNGNTPLHVAASVGATDVVRFLAGLGVRINMLSKCNRTPKQLAIEKEFTEVVAVLERAEEESKELLSSVTPAAGNAVECQNTKIPVSLITDRIRPTIETPFRPPYARHDVSGVLIAEEDLRREFLIFDKDNKGFVMKSEFKAYYYGLEHFGLPPTSKSVEAMLKRFRVVGVDRITFEEFAIMMCHHAQR